MYKPTKKCLRTNISPGLIFGGLRYDVSNFLYEYIKIGSNSNLTFNFYNITFSRRCKNVCCLARIIYITFFLYFVHPHSINTCDHRFIMIQDEIRWWINRGRASYFHRFTKDGRERINCDGNVFPTYFT